MRLRFLTFLCVLAVYLLSPALAAAEKLLRWNFQSGQALQIELDQDVDMSTDAMGNSMRSSADMGMTLAWRVREVNADGVAQIDQTIDRIRMKMIMPGSAAVEFDSAAALPDNAMGRHMAESINPMIGVRFAQQITDRGEVVDMQLTEEGAKDLQAATGAPVQEAFSHEGLKTLLSQAALVLPKHPVKPGDSWEGTSEMDSPIGTLAVKTTYTYRGTEKLDGRPLERIDLVIAVKFAGGPNATGLEVKVAQQNNTGTMYFDAAFGRFVSSDVVQSMTMETQLGERVHRQQLNTRLRMTVSETAELAAGADGATRR